MFLWCRHQASLTVWWIILRFMGDLPEPKNQVEHQKIAKEYLKVLNEEEPTLDRPLTTLQKLHIIVGYAIVRQDLR